MHLAAIHMHTALVLLNRTLALWTGLGVRQNPIQVFTLRTVLANPLCHSAAIHLQHMQPRASDSHSLESESVRM